MQPVDQRETVFARIREALRVAAPHRHADGHAHEDAPPSAGMPGTDTFRAWLPPVGPTLAEQIELFAANSVNLKTEFRRFGSLPEASQHLAQLAKDNNWTHLATHEHELTIPLVTPLALSTLLTDPGYEVTDMERCQAAITGCDSLVAQTGSILVTGGSAGGRALSVLPPHHVVIARESQMVADLPTALHEAHIRYAAKWPSFLSFITGPSRTGDIERILVLGAHGPKKLTVLLIP